MKSLSVLSMSTKRGHTSTWHFCEGADGKFYAFGGCHKPLIKRFDSIDELRVLYCKYVTYGYTAVESQLPANMQLELALL